MYAPYVALRCLETVRAKAEIRVLHSSIRLGNPITGTQPFDYRLNNLDKCAVDSHASSLRIMVVQCKRNTEQRFRRVDYSEVTLAACVNV